MNVGELKKMLVEYPDDMLVVLSIDPEGNGFNPLQVVEDNSVYVREDREVHIAKLTPELIEQGYCDEDIHEGESCIVLWP